MRGQFQFDGRSRRTRRASSACAIVTAIALSMAPAANADRTQLRPGWNLFSPQQDVELGRKVAQDAEHKLPMLNNSRVDGYLNRLGHQLASKAPGQKYPYQYKCVNDSVINAFALPGGFVYINRGVIEAADNEAQLAAVMGHETSHVALRHGTNMASKATLEQSGLAILGGLLGGSVAGAVAQQVGGFALNSVLLKNSRDVERQADVLGTQIMYDSGYDPRAMSQFFEKLQAEERKNGRPLEFFSNHPSPDHRIERVNEEIAKLGGPPPNARRDSKEFQDIKRYVLSLPPAPKGGRRAAGSAVGTGARPVPPATSFQNYENGILSLRFPSNWRANGQGSAAALVPDGGLVDDGQGGSALAWGIIVNLHEPHGDSGGNVSLEEATSELLGDLQRNNPGMRVTRRAEPMRLGGERALSMYLSNDSAIGGKETVWLVTALRPEGLVHLICVAPEQDFDQYDRAFQAVVSSVRFRN